MNENKIDELRDEKRKREKKKKEKGLTMLEVRT